MFKVYCDISVRNARNVAVSSIWTTLIEMLTVTIHLRRTWLVAALYGDCVDKCGFIEADPRCVSFLLCQCHIRLAYGGKLP